jgi:hypothetical protein
LPTAPVLPATKTLIATARHAAYAKKLSHAEPMDVKRAAELKALPGVGCRGLVTLL